MNKFAVIVAGGSGSRMQSTLPKQYMLLDDKPILMYSIEAFYQADPRTGIIVVIAKEMERLWNELCQAHAFDIPHQTVYGGGSRPESVYQGLLFIATDEIYDGDSSLVAVHDGARPLISSEEINVLFAEAKVKKCVVPAVASINSIRIGTVSENKTLERNLVWQIQTPQVFYADLLTQCYRSVIDELALDQFTDDASVAEKMGNTIYLCPGSYRNIKITNPEDIGIAQVYLKNGK